MKYLLFLIPFLIYAQDSPLLILMGDDGVAIPSYLTDSDARAWYDASDASTFTLSGADVTGWTDKSGQGNDLESATNQYPSYADGEVTFDGTDEYMDVSFTQEFPITVYVLIKQNTWTAGDCLFDGEQQYRGLLQQNDSEPDVRLYAGSGLVYNSDFSMNTYHIITILWGTLGVNNCSIQIDRETATTGDIGIANAPHGITIGADGGLSAFGDITIKQYIMRAGLDSQQIQDEIYNWLLTK